MEGMECDRSVGRRKKKQIAVAACDLKQFLAATGSNYFRKFTKIGESSDLNFRWLPNFGSFHRRKCKLEVKPCRKCRASADASYESGHVTSKSAVCPALGIKDFLRDNDPKHGVSFALLDLVVYCPIRRTAVPDTLKVCSLTSEAIPGFASL